LDRFDLARRLDRVDNRVGVSEHDLDRHRGRSTTRAGRGRLGFVAGRRQDGHEDQEAR
jgi:hypothetical protein